MAKPITGLASGIRLREQARPSASVCLTVIAAIVTLFLVGQARGAATHFYTTLERMHVVGYQGWFFCPGDGAKGVGWGHWFRDGANLKDPNAVAVDLWPDTSELDPDEKCPTPFHLRSGAPAFLFSDFRAKTVARHFAWMREYGIDGAAMQRFLTTIAHDALKRDFDVVLKNAQAGAEANRRGLFVMYDLSGMNGAAALQALSRDWRHLTDDLRLTDSPAYIFDRGRPVVGIWGIGFRDRNVTPQQAQRIIDFFHTARVPATVLGGVPASWRNLGADREFRDARTDPQWASVYRSLDIISPWSVGRFGDSRGADAFARARIAPDVAAARRLGIQYMPVVFPGFSWHHGAGFAGHAPINGIPRQCGKTYRHQIDNAIKSGATMLYTAMFDEINEGTAIFKLVAQPSQEPVGTELLPLSADGCPNATSDMYLRIAGRATQTLRGSP